MNPDPRIHAYRPDLADMTLRDSVTALRYVEPVMRQCLRGVLPLLAAPKPDARQISQVRYGEFMDVFETRDDGFLWVQNRADRYVYPEPDIKSPPVDELTLGSFVSLAGKQERLLELTNGGFVYEAHVMATEFANTSDYVFTAGRLLHTPYLWGGRTPKGIDCSGLIQLALEMADIDCPRDSDQQREAFGKPLHTHWRDRAWRRGDIVFFLPDPHVGFMTDTDHIIHANATTMDVTVEPLSNVGERGNEVVAVGSAGSLWG